MDNYENHQKGMKTLKKALITDIILKYLENLNKLELEPT